MPELKPMMCPVTLQGAENLIAGDDECRALFHAALARASLHQNVRSLTIYCDARNRDGWLEYTMIFGYEGGGRFTLGCIQRKPGEAFEFHS